MIREKYRIDQKYSAVDVEILSKICCNLFARKNEIFLFKFSNGKFVVPYFDMLELTPT